MESFGIPCHCIFLTSLKWNGPAKKSFTLKVRIWQIEQMIAFTLIGFSKKFTSSEGMDPLVFELSANL